MILFDKRMIFKNCGARRPLEDGRDGASLVVSKGGVEIYQKIVPQLYSACNRGFYFQLILMDYEFERFYGPSIRHKKSFFLPSQVPENLPEPTKKIETLEGRLVELPVLSGMIHINRGMFPPRGDQENEKLWLDLLPDRALKIAHELLYAEQYAALYDPKTRKLNAPLQPHLKVDEQEEDLVCSFEDLERTLHTAEMYHASPIHDPEDLDAFLLTAHGERFLDLWLKEFSVDREVVMKRAKLYLAQAPRKEYPILAKRYMSNTLRQFSLSELDYQEFLRHLTRRTAIGQYYLDCWRAAYGFLEQTLIAFITQIHYFQHRAA